MDADRTTPFEMSECQDGRATKGVAGKEPNITAIHAGGSSITSIPSKTEKVLVHFALLPCDNQKSPVRVNAQPV